MIGHYEIEGIIPPADHLQALADSLEVPVCKLFKQPEIEQNPENDFTEIDPRSVKSYATFFHCLPMIAAIFTVY